MPFFSKKDNSNTSPELFLNDVISTFDSFFTEEYLSKPNVFFENKSEDNSFQMNELIEIDQSKLDETINQIRDGLYYNFITSFWRQKENLKLIDDLKAKLQKIEDSINKQKQEVLILEKNKLLIDQNKINDDYLKNIAVLSNTNYYMFLNFLSKKLKKDIIFFEETNLKIVNNKKNLLVEFQKLKNKINKEIQKLEHLNETLDNKIKNIFKDNIYKETLMTQLILSFWAFRLKNSKKYDLNLEQKEIKNCNNEDFLVFFELINKIFSEYIEKLINNEEKIFYDILKKYYDNKKELENEQKNEDENKTKLKQELDEINKELTEKNKILTSLENTLKNNDKIINNLKKRKYDIKKKNNTFEKDWLESKDNADEHAISILPSIDNITKQEYLNQFEEKIKKIKSDLKSDKRKIIENKDYITILNTKLKINNKNLTLSKKEITSIKNSHKSNDKQLEQKIKDIVKKWTKKISKSEKLFLKNFQSLSKKEFINYIENFWNIEENKTIVLNLNKSYSIEKNMKEIEDCNNKILEEIKNDILTLTTNFETHEEEKIAKAKNDLKSDLKCDRIELVKIDNPHLDLTSSVETQTSIEEKSNWEEQKISELEEKLEKRDNEINNLIKKISKVHEEYTEENEVLKAKFDEYKTKNMEETESLKLILEKLKDKINGLNNELLLKIKQKKENNKLVEELKDLELTIVEIEEFQEERTVDEKTKLTLEHSKKQTFMVQKNEPQPLTSANLRSKFNNELVEECNKTEVQVHSIPQESTIQSKEMPPC